MKVQKLLRKNVVHKNATEWDTEQHVTAPNMITDNVKLITFSKK
jgi:hypothetical protein